MLYCASHLDGFIRAPCLEVHSTPAPRVRAREPSAHVTRNHTMNPIEVVRRYNQAWNGRDANAIVQLFAEGGTYSNPHAGQGLTGEAIGNYAKAVWAALPDMTAELVSVRENRAGPSRA